jgi:hypothetical protein
VLEYEVPQPSEGPTFSLGGNLVRFRVAGLAGILVLLAFTFGTAFGHGHTADQLVAAGWTCSRLDLLQCWS